MAENPQQEKVTVNTTFYYNGSQISEGEELGPGTVRFVHTLRQPDGKTTTLTDEMTLDADFFKDPKIKIGFTTNIPTLAPGASLPMQFEITEGELYEGDQTQVLFSQKGDKVENFGVYQLLSFEKREFSFQVPNNINSSECYLALLAVSADNKILGQKLSNKFAIQKTPMDTESPRIVLLTPNDGTTLFLGSSQIFKWAITNIRSEETTLFVSITLSYNSPYRRDSPSSMIKNLYFEKKEPARTSDNITVTLPEDNEAQRCTIMLHLFKRIPDPSKNYEGYIKEWGENSTRVFFHFNLTSPPPYTEPLENVTEELANIERLLGAIRLPSKGWLSSKVSVGTYLYYLIHSPELQNYITAANRLQEIHRELQARDVQQRIGTLAQDFATQMYDLNNLRTKVTGLERAQEVKGRLRQLLQVFIPVINKELLENFRKHHRVDMRALRADILLNNMDYLSWIMEHAQQIDTLLNIQGESTLNGIYLYVQTLQKDTEQFLYQLKALRTTLQKIRKVLATRR